MTVIWIDSSFAIEWLLGTRRAKRVNLGDEVRSTLPAQYAEIFIFFLRHGYDPVHIVNELEGLDLWQPQKTHLQRAGFLYLEARKRKGKASLADAILAAVAYVRQEKIASFDQDFSRLGFSHRNGLWSSS